MLFSGFVSNVSKPFALKSNQNVKGVFFTLMVNNGDKNAKYIKCLTYSKTLIDVLENSTNFTVIRVLKGYPDTSYSKDYLNIVTRKEGLSIQHFVVTSWDTVFNNELEEHIKDSSSEYDLNKPSEESIDVEVNNSQNDIKEENISPSENTPNNINWNKVIPNFKLEDESQVQEETEDKLKNWDWDLD